MQSKSYIRWLLVAAVILSAFTMMINQTILSVAQPHLMNTFNISTSTVQWLSTG